MSRNHVYSQCPGLEMVNETADPVSSVTAGEPRGRNAAERTRALLPLSEPKIAEVKSTRTLTEAPPAGSESCTKLEFTIPLPWAPGTAARSA